MVLSVRAKGESRCGKALPTERTLGGRVVLSYGRWSGVVAPFDLLISKADDLWPAYPKRKPLDKEQSAEADPANANPRRSRPANPTTRVSESQRATWFVKVHFDDFGLLRVTRMRISIVYNGSRPAMRPSVVLSRQSSLMRNILNSYWFGDAPARRMILPSLSCISESLVYPASHNDAHPDKNAYAF